MKPPPTRLWTRTFEEEVSQALLFLNKQMKESSSPSSLISKGLQFGNQCP
ncbi:Hypothetical protein FKW44_010286 [Caligus rogercresseyi]|uniref:Uncharacterized protein n=1 Tax=Caligus rogercresseyi TaxID=217165 RepID=A0A7T8K790_CALRO|nr:Hypothetical protein FKW44_010286 [Caligus rogercresseyi]